MGNGHHRTLFGRNEKDPLPPPLTEEQLALFNSIKLIEVKERKLPTFQVIKDGTIIGFVRNSFGNIQAKLVDGDCFLPVWRAYRDGEPLYVRAVLFLLQ